MQKQKTDIVIDNLNDSVGEVHSSLPESLNDAGLLVHDEVLGHSDLTCKPRAPAESVNHRDTIHGSRFKHSQQNDHKDEDLLEGDGRVNFGDLKEMHSL